MPKQKHYSIERLSLLTRDDGDKVSAWEAVANVEADLARTALEKHLAPIDCIHAEPGFYRVIEVGNPYGTIDEFEVTHRTEVNIARVNQQTAMQAAA